MPFTFEFLGFFLRKLHLFQFTCVNISDYGRSSSSEHFLLYFSKFKQNLSNLILIWFNFIYFVLPLNKYAITTIFL